MLLVSQIVCALLLYNLIHKLSWIIGKYIYKNFRIIDYAIYRIYPNPNNPELVWDPISYFRKPLKRYNCPHCSGRGIHRDENHPCYVCEGKGWMNKEDLIRYEQSWQIMGTTNPQWNKEINKNLTVNK